MASESATSDRIWFLGNPWPKGHKITEFKWGASLREGETGKPKEVWCWMQLMTEDYNAEGPGVDEGSSDFGDARIKKLGWTSPGVWRNYNSCGFTANESFRLCTQEQFNPDFLDGHENEVDMDRKPEERDREPAFDVYLLGHDDVGFHRMRFERVADSNKFKIFWSGKIALTYCGQDDY